MDGCLSGDTTTTATTETTAAAECRQTQPAAWHRHAATRASHSCSIKRLAACEPAARTEKVVGAGLKLRNHAGTLVAADAAKRPALHCANNGNVRAGRPGANASAHRDVARLRRCHLLTEVAPVRCNLRIAWGHAAGGSNNGRCEFAAPISSFWIAMLRHE